MPHTRSTQRLLLLTGTALFASLLLASPALANPGAGLFLTIYLHLFVGNLLIGILEGAILWLVFKAKWWRAILLMILANYFSAWIGMFFLSPIIWLLENTFFPGPPLLHIKQLYAGVLLALFFVTLALEAPFCFYAFRKKRRAFKRVLKGLLLTQFVSYGILFMYYASTGMHMPVYDDLRVEADPAEVVRPIDATVYYISEDAERLESIHLATLQHRVAATIDDTQREKHNIDATHGLERLNGTLQILQEIASKELEDGATTLTRLEASHYPTRQTTITIDGTKHTWQYKRYFDFEPEDDTGAVLGKLRRGASPHDGWYVLRGTLLPNGLFVCVYGPQIVVMDPVHKTIAPLAIGGDPVVVLAPDVEPAKIEYIEEEND